MEAITFKCPACEKPLTVPKEAASAEGPCPTCGVLIQGPGASGQPKLLAPAAPGASKPANGEAPKSPAGPAPSPKEAPKSTAGRQPVPEKSPAKTSKAGAKPTLKDVPPPAPAPAGKPPREVPERKASPPARAGKPGDPGKLPQLALHLLLFFVALTLGYLIGKQSATKGTEESIPLVSAKNTEKSGGAPASSPEDATPTPPEVPADPAPEVAEEEETLPALAALRAFLSAEDWSSRQVHVLAPTTVLADMEKTAKREGDGPIAFESIARLPTRDQNKERIFQVVTEQHPNGFPVSLTKVDSQWLVDWDGFSECYYEELVRHAGAETGSKGSFRVLLRPDESGKSDYLLSPPSLAESFAARIEHDSPPHKRISSILKYYTSNFPDEYAQSIAEGGIPLILELTRADSESGYTFLVTDFVSTTWSPTPPKTAGGDSES